MPVLVGTASWTDKSLIECGRFYPKDVADPRMGSHERPVSALLGAEQVNSRRFTLDYRSRP